MRPMAGDHQDNSSRPNTLSELAQVFVVDKQYHYHQDTLDITGTNTRQSARQSQARMSDVTEKVVSVPLSSSRPCQLICFPQNLSLASNIPANIPGSASCERNIMCKM